MDAQRPKILDLFCGAGGCAVGYHRAGFDVLGVDHRPQPRYPFQLVQADAMDFLGGIRNGDFDAIHASPPCQAYSVMNSMVGSKAPRLIAGLRRRLRHVGLPFVIENVEGADLEGHIVMLCGTMFGLRVRRHRLFEIEPPVLMLTPPCQCRHGVLTGHLIGHRTGGRVRPGRQRPPAFTESDRRDAIGVSWMSARAARQAIPPAYTEFIGKHLLPSIQAPPKE